MKHKQDRGLVLDLNSSIFKVDAYPDSDVEGMYGHKNHDDTSCAKCHNIFIIKFADCRILLIYKFAN